MKLNLKSNFILIVSYYSKIDDKLIKTDEKIIKCNKKQLEKELDTIKTKVEYVTSRPTSFNLGVFYILNNSNKAPDYIYTYQLN